MILISLVDFEISVNNFFSYYMPIGNMHPKRIHHVQGICGGSKK